ncbi:MAG: RidA family protein [Chloroflexi bacterium]|nr:RidA family protein [Chloroflexota bacterium]
MRRHHVRPDGLPPANGYSHAVEFSGRLVVLSGQVPLDADGQLVGADDPEAQVRQVFENLRMVLAAAGATFEDVVKITVFLTDLADLDIFRRVRNEYIVLDAPPASSAIRVAGLVNPAFRVEVEALAVLPGSS